MASLVALIALLSIDVTRGLVALGLGLGYDTTAAAATSSGVGRFAPGFAPLAIVAATNATPIVVTTAYPHGVSARGIGGMSCIVSGVTGNDAANNVDADPRSVTIGLNAGVLAVPLTATTLALYGQSPVTGRLVALAGSGTYTGGGTIVPALTDGSILIGRATSPELGAPPRIVAIPKGVAKWAPKTANLASLADNSERQAQLQQRSIRSALHVFEIQCWGQSSPPNPATDYDPTFALASQVVDSSHLLFGTERELYPGTWDDEKERASQNIKAGHLFSFAIGINTPITDNPIAGGLPFVPAGTLMETTVQTDTPKVGAVFDLTLDPG